MRVAVPLPSPDDVAPASSPGFGTPAGLGLQNHLLAIAIEELLEIHELLIAFKAWALGTVTIHSPVTGRIRPGERESEGEAL
jgi:hypothetical protein